MPGNLPEGLTPFIGRRRELADVRNLLSETRVLTLTGPGGVGKTRLALAVAADRRRAFPDGVWYADLEGIEDEKLLAGHLADLIGLRHDAGDGGPALSLIRSLRDRHLLLVLDNCEHLVKSVALLVDAMARTCPKVHVLATGRTPLRTAGDVTYQVPQLGMPHHSSVGPELNPDSSDAVRFFMDRARAAQPGFELTAHNRTDVHELVRRLDRLPLAMELAAVRLRSVTVRQIIQHLADTRAMLNWGSRSAPPRRQTMRASLQWSAELCTEEERHLWARLSVFRGTFDLDAVEAVCGDASTADTLIDLLQGLVEQSVITREDQGVTVRYSMLGGIREFGRELLDEQYAETDLLRSRHTDWYFALIARADEDWNTERQAHWLHSLPLDRKNIVHALNNTTADATQVNAAAEAVRGLWRYFWWACGWLSEGFYWVDRCSRLLTTPTSRARLFGLGSLLAWTVGDEAAGVSLLSRGQAAAEASGDRLAQALAEHVRGDAALYCGQPAAAVGHFRHALSLYDAAAAQHRVDTLIMLTHTHAVLGDLAGAEAAHREAMAILVPSERFQRSYCLMFLGEALYRGGGIDRALDTLREALRLKAELDDPFGVAWAFEILAKVAGESRQHKRAALLQDAAERMWKSMAIDISTLMRLRIRAESPDLGTPPRDVHAGTAEPISVPDRPLHEDRVSIAAVIAMALSDGDVPGAAAASPNPAPLTAREEQIAALVADGLPNKEIAAKLVIARRTVDGHVQNILTKLGFNSRSQIAAWVTTRPDIRTG
ncbi:LuxR C-terminal-related transcriptional regulator [Streptomyces sp. NBC_00144]|uniref:LuxR C-terminal-related transcriptional regulator n=1 Tax=Streptomyces sp. NBC_00144 TaxID=2975665 RepID=UPI00324BC578